MTTTTTTTRKLAEAVTALDATQISPLRYAHYANETGRWYVVSRAALLAWHDYPEQDRYSHWCAGETCKEMPEGWTP